MGLWPYIVEYTQKNPIYKTEKPPKLYVMVKAKTFWPPVVLSRYLANGSDRRTCTLFWKVGIDVK